MPSQLNLRDITNYIAIGIAYIFLAILIYWNYFGENPLTKITSDWMQAGSIIVVSYYIGMLVPGAIPYILKLKSSEDNYLNAVLCAISGINKNQDIRAEVLGDGNPITKIVDKKLCELFSANRKELCSSEKVDVFYLALGM